MKVIEKKLKCGARITLSDGLQWYNAAAQKTERLITVVASDPNQSFNYNREGKLVDNISINISRNAIPGLVRMLTRAFKESKNLKGY